MSLSFCPPRLHDEVFFVQSLLVSSPVTPLRPRYSIRFELVRATKAKLSPKGASSCL